MTDCIFCRIENPVLENEMALAFYDKYPVNPGHLLVIPKRHVSSLFETTAAEREAIFELLQQVKDLVE
ncbi:MAG TPA: HIT family protein, partial [Bacillota bacterium]|nr:HIT family protein [Bacillota bacterium]